MSPTGSKKKAKRFSLPCSLPPPRLPFRDGRQPAWERQGGPGAGQPGHRRGRAEGQPGQEGPRRVTLFFCMFDAYLQEDKINAVYGRKLDEVSHINS